MGSTSIFRCKMALLSNFMIFFLNEDIVKNVKPDGICSLTFVVDGFSRLFLQPSIFSIK